MTCPTKAFTILL